MANKVIIRSIPAQQMNPRSNRFISMKKQVTRCGKGPWPPHRSRTNPQRYSSLGRSLVLGMLVVFLRLGYLGAAQEPTTPLTAPQVLERVISKYQTLPSYQSSGTVVMEIDTGSKKIHTQTTFTLRLQKPTQFLIRWTQQNLPAPHPQRQGAVWSQEKESFIYLEALKAYGKMGSIEMALGGAVGVSGGCAYTIPTLTLDVFKEQPHPFTRLQDPKIASMEKIGEEECYVIRGASTISKQETFWISKSRFLILKYQRSLEPPEGGITIPEMTDQQVTEALQGLGQEVTDANMQQMRTMMEKSKTLFETAQMKGSVTEQHHEITSPEFKPEDFQFSIPEGTELKESLLGGLLGQ